ncbi:protein disulfide-isomerase precursor [Coemansia sp. RSA 552]|nr:protein disulfide-isomerase precursor [Coemansia sp. RSA 552]
MRFSLGALAVAAGLVASAAASVDKKAVHVLTEANFYEWTMAQSLALVEFYAPWCVYCQALEVPYAMAAATLKKEGIPLAKVDCTVEEDLCEEMDVSGYPTLRVVHKGILAPFNGTRDETGIVGYMRQHMKPALPEVRASGLSKFKKSSEVVVVGYMGARTSEHAALEEVAREFRDEYTFGFVAGAGEAKRERVEQPAVVVYKDEGTDVEVHSGQMTTDAIRQFVRASSVPALGELSSQTFSTYVRAALPIGLIFYNSDKSREDLEHQLRDVAREYKHVVSMAFVDARIYSKHAKMLNLRPQWPAFAIQNVAARTKYLLPQDRSLSEPDLRRFVASYADGRISPDYKSEPNPVSNNGDVYTLVSRQFNDVVLDKTKDVLVLFYAPWCIHCKRMMPAYEELGRQMHGLPNLVVARMDATANDVPSSDAELDIAGYPTVVLVRANDNRIIRYRGNRSKQSFVDFLKLHAMHSVADLPDAAVERADGQPAQEVMPHHDFGFTPKETRHIEL